MEMVVIIWFGKRNIQKQHRHYVFWGSKILGGVLNAAWFGLIVAFITIVITLMPRNFFGLASTQKIIYESTSYGQFHVYLIRPFPAIKNIYTVTSIFKNPTALNQYSDSIEGTFAHFSYRQGFQHIFCRFNYMPGENN